MTTALVADCGCGGDEFAALADVADEVQVDTLPDPRGTKLTRWSGLIAPIGVETGDGRRFAANALTNRDLPVALRWHREDDGGHKRVVVVGTVDEVEYKPDGVYGAGILLDPDPEVLPRLAEDVAEARLLLEQNAIGPSVDLDEMEFTVQDPGPDANPNVRPKVDVDKGRISAVTLVQIPAFAETKGIELTEVDAESYTAVRAVLTAAAAGWEEVVSIPGWTPAQALAEMERNDLYDTGAQAFAVVTETGERFYPIRALVDGRFVVVREAVEFAQRALAHGAPDSIPDGRVAELREHFAALLAMPATRPDVEPEEEGALVAAAAPVAPPDEWFENPGFTQVTPLTITADGRVYGHLADWRTCHTGFTGTCVLAPKSRHGYAYFHTGEVLTASGRAVGVGRITFGGGHADTRLGFQAAVAHYDNAGTCVAAVRAGEDKFGIWLAGSLVPGVDEITAAAVRRHPPSGDWRRVGGSLELVGALSVNTPGFPVPRSRVASGAPQALVAAGYVPGEGGSSENMTTVEAVEFAMREERKRRRRSYDAAVAFVEASDQQEDGARLLAGWAAMPAFLKKKIADDKAEADENDEPCDDDDEECKERKKKAKLPFGGKKAEPFGAK